MLHLTVLLVDMDHTLEPVRLTEPTSFFEREIERGLETAVGMFAPTVLDIHHPLLSVE